MAYITEKNLNKNLEIFRHLFILDERTIAAIKGDILRRDWHKSSFFRRLSYRPWFICVVSVFERIFASSLSKRFDSAGDDFVFVSCIDPVHIVKTLPVVANDFNYTLFFLPTVTRPTTVRKYYNHYKNNSSEKVFFGTFSLDDIKKFSRFLRQNTSFINQIQCDNENDTQLLKDYLRRFALYRIYVQRVFANANKDKLWLFEHDKFFFIPVINFFRGKGITTIQLQHGTFFNPVNTTYFPLYSDKVICCSAREKEQYKENGVKDADIYIVGAPLQTICLNKRLDVEEKYDLTVVLAATTPKELALQKKVLMFIKDNFKSKKVLLRFRPRSAAVDKENLTGYTDGFSFSHGTTLSEDICAAGRIITFSLDSIYEIIHNDKIFVTIIDSSDKIGHMLEGVCHTIDEMADCIKALFEATSNSKREQYVPVFGETDLEKIKENFAIVIAALKAEEKGC